MYKIGDIVKVTGRSYGHGFKIGEVVKLIEARGTTDYIAKGDGSSWWLRPDEIELIRRQR